MFNDLLSLFLNFFYIGAFAFGGGYAMIPMFQDLVLEHGWMTIGQFTDMIAISQMTPGPIAINMATYIGYQTAGVAGSLVSTLAVCLPSFILVTLLINFVMKFEEHRIIQSIFSVLRPVVAGLIGAAAYLIAINSTLINTVALREGASILQVLDPLSIALAAAIIFAIYKFKRHPILYIALAGIVGAIWM